MSQERFAVRHGDAISCIRVRLAYPTTGNEQRRAGDIGIDCIGCRGRVKLHLQEGFTAAEHHGFRTLAALRRLSRCTPKSPKWSMWGIHRLRFRLWHTAHLRDLAVEVEVGWSAAGDQPRTATEGQILYRPLDENENATLERNQICYMDKSPNQPRYEPGNVNTENIGHRRCPSNHRQRPFVEV